MGRFATLAFTDAVLAKQDELGSRKAYAKALASGATRDRLGDDEAAFLAARDSFYLASVSETGWPYVQHRGGPRGFVRVLDEHTLGFLDYRGNRQYVSVGNVTRDDRVALIFVDYPARARLKVLAHAELVALSDRPELVTRLAVDDARIRPERAVLLHVEGFDWNCPQHITPRFTEDEVRASVAPLLAKLADLERDNAELRARLDRVQQREQPIRPA